jgi:hypothetical protein
MKFPVNILKNKPLSFAEGLIIGIIGVALILLTFSQKDEFFSPDNHLEIRLQRPNKKLERPLQILRETRPEVMSLYQIGNENDLYFMFSTAKHVGEEPMPIDSAYSNYVANFTSTFTTALESGLYKSGTMKLYRKISFLDAGDSIQTYNLMIYFMKNDYSNEMYELKGSCGERELEYMKNIMGRMAESIRFK